MSKSSKRRSDEEYRPSRKYKKRKSDEFKVIQQVRLLDLINANLLTPGTEVFVKEQEGVITEKGTIRVLSHKSNNESIEYSNPTSWTRQATGRESGGWAQIRLKSSKVPLSTLKEQYLKNIADNDDELELNEISEREGQQFSTTPPASPAEDIPLPLQVRFLGDDTRTFKIVWVSSDYKEFHIEYQGETFENLAEFVNKVYSEVLSGEAPNTNLKFDALMYELEPGKWVRLAGNLFPNGKEKEQFTQEAVPSPDTTTENENDSADSADADRSNTIISTASSVEASQTSPIVRFPLDNTTKDNSPEDTKPAAIIISPPSSPVSPTTTIPNSNTSVAVSSLPVPPLIPSTPSHQMLIPTFPSCSACPHYYPTHKILVYLESESSLPSRVNSCATTRQELESLIIAECGLGIYDLSDYDVSVYDEEFGVYTKFPRDLAHLPNKCKMVVKKRNGTTHTHTNIDNAPPTNVGHVATSTNANTSVKSGNCDNDVLLVPNSV